MSEDEDQRPVWASLVETGLLPPIDTSLYGFAAFELRYELAEPLSSANDAGYGTGC